MLLRKGIYPCEYTYSCKRFEETSFLIKKLYSELNLENITHEDCIHAQKLFEEFINKESKGISWYICSKWYIIACRCIWQF